MNSTDTTTQAAQFGEAALDPDLPIIDTHHHMYDMLSGKALKALRWERFMAKEYADYVSGGHNVIASVHVDSFTARRRYGPVEFAPVGETEFANGQAAMAASGVYGPCLVAAAIVTTADLTLGDAVRPVLEAHMAASPHRFRGIRTMALWDSDPNVVENPGLSFHGEKHFLNEHFRKGFAHLAPLGLTFDGFVLAPQLDDFLDLARAFPDTQMILNHMGNPVGIGRHKGKMEEEFPEWRAKMAAIAELENVVVKFGGLGTFLSGSKSYRADPPASSEVLAAEWRPYAESTVELFGANRCMFESNLPTDASGPFNNVCNAYKRLTAGCSQSEREQIFAGTAKRIYRIEIPEFRLNHSPTH